MAFLPFYSKVAKIPTKIKVKLTCAQLVGDRREVDFDYVRARTLKNLALYRFQ
ncbi:hypothetical protein [Iningainema tapete]|uniref:Uncharacterized protein n=1 Tax=Iningainema tapete BLCC-T55 TaxID=2748662 RepID=A0A8J7CDN0_9CYAN|nr:hypothetical protein [Iningainema tapete BLCC-T55]